MSRKPSTQPLLDADHAAFIRGGVSIIAASSDAALIPSVERAVGCKLSADRRRVTIFVGSVSAQRLLDDVRRSGRIAVVFSHPPTHRTIQLKGADAAIAPLVSADRRIVADYADALVATIGGLGHPEPLLRAMLACPAEDVTAVAFTPAAAFVQTPGPRAGTPLAR